MLPSIRLDHSWYSWKNDFKRTPPILISVFATKRHIFCALMWPAHQHVFFYLPDPKSFGKATTIECKAHVLFYPLPIDASECLRPKTETGPWSDGRCALPNLPAHFFLKLFGDSINVDSFFHKMLDAAHGLQSGSIQTRFCKPPKRKI